MPLKISFRGARPGDAPRLEGTESMWGRVLAIAVAVLFALCIVARFISILAGGS
jgi:hypothetical protein